MPSLSAGQTASLVLAPGDSYTISTTGVVTVEVIYGAPSATTTLTSNWQKFGPYGVPAKLDVVAVSGAASYGLDQYEGAPLYGKENPLTGKVAKSIVVMTQAQYDALATKDAETIYVIEG